MAGMRDRHRHSTYSRRLKAGIFGEGHTMGRYRQDDCNQSRYRLRRARDEAPLSADRVSAAGELARPLLELEYWRFKGPSLTQGAAGTAYF